jgi:hypothetical protein
VVATVVEVGDDHRVVLAADGEQPAIGTSSGGPDLERPAIDRQRRRRVVGRVGQR